MSSRAIPFQGGRARKKRPETLLSCKLSGHFAPAETGRLCVKPCKSMSHLQCALDFHDLEGFDHISVLDIIVACNRETALLAGNDLLDTVLAYLQ